MPKFSELTAAQALADEDILAVSQDVTGTLSSRKTTLEDVAEYVTSGLPGAPVTSVNGETGAVVLDFPVDSVNGQTDVVVLDTDDVAEGSTNLYFTEARIRYNVETLSGTSETLVLADSVSKWKSLNNGSAIVLTVPPQSSVVWPADTYIEVYQAGAGAITFTPGAGVTINVNANLTLVTNGQYAVAGLKRIAEDSWVVFGNLVPA